MNELTISPLKQLTAQVESEPVYNALNSLSLLNDVEQAPSIRLLSSPRVNDQIKLNDWVLRTSAELTSNQRMTNRLIFEVLRGSLPLVQDQQDFPSWLEALGRHDTDVIRADILRNAGSIEAFLEATEPAQRGEAQALLADSAALRDVIVAHLRQMWDGRLSDEWRSAQQRIESQVNIFRRRLTPELTAAELLRIFTGRPLPSGLRNAPLEARRIVLVPSPHNDRYVTTWQSDGTLRLFFGAPPNYPVVMRTSPVGYGELRAGLAPLADETRVHILELLAQHAELSAQELIGKLGISQPSVSRHVKELRGFLFERRGEGASKIYSLNALNLDRVVQGLDRLLAGDEAPAEQLDERADHPQELRRFLDSQGRVTSWPTKDRDRRLVMEYLSGRFEPGRSYTEKEVNTILVRNMHPYFKDFVTIRRAMYDYRYMHRERDGSRYWLADADAAGQPPKPRTPGDLFYSPDSAPAKE